jgi:hypothetical protein
MSAGLRVYSRVFTLFTTWKAFFSDRVDCL